MVAHTHCCILLGVKRIFWRQSYRCRSRSLPEPKPEDWAALEPRIGYARSAQAARKRGVLFAHLKCAPVRRALSATDSVCSLLQDGGSAPIHFLLIASQLSLSIRLKTHRSPAEPPGLLFPFSQHASDHKDKDYRAQPSPHVRPVWRIFHRRNDHHRMSSLILQDVHCALLGNQQILSHL